MQTLAFAPSPLHGDPVVWQDTLGFHSDSPSRKPHDFFWLHHICAVVARTRWFVESFSTRRDGHSAELASATTNSEMARGALSETVCGMTFHQSRLHRHGDSEAHKLRPWTSSTRHGDSLNISVGDTCNKRVWPRLPTHMCQPPARKTISPRQTMATRSDGVFTAVDGAWCIALLCQILVSGVHELDGYETLHP